MRKDAASTQFSDEEKAFLWSSSSPTSASQYSSLCPFLRIPISVHVKDKASFHSKTLLSWSLLARWMTTELQWPWSCNLRPEGLSFLYFSLKLFFLPFIALPHGFACWNSHHSRLSSDAAMKVSLVIPVGKGSLTSAARASCSLSPSLDPWPSWRLE